MSETRVILESEALQKFLEYEVQLASLRRELEKAEAELQGEKDAMQPYFASIRELEKDLSTEQQRIDRLKKPLSMFDVTKSGPLSPEEIKQMELAVMPLLLDSDDSNNFSLLVARLIQTVDAEREAREKAEKEASYFKDRASTFLNRAMRAEADHDEARAQLCRAREIIVKLGGNAADDVLTELRRRILGGK